MENIVYVNNVEQRTVLWYWPTSPKGLRDGPDTMWILYGKCLA
jgi:hypothetical protein